MTKFDPDKGAGVFQGQFLTFDCVDSAEPGEVPNLVLDGTRPFNINVEWELRGTDTEIASIMNDTHGDWTVEIYAESIGPGPEIRIATGTVPRGAPHTWVNGVRFSPTTPLVVAANTLPESNPNSPNGPSGIYKLACSCFIDGRPELPGKHDVVGFDEGTVIRIENTR